MCGIFGGIGVGADEARNCLDKIRRGNDGITVREFGGVIMGSRRHLVKESAKPGVKPGESDQPYSSDDGKIHLVFNGELYNFADFRNELIQSGVSFETEGDTEVWLKLFERDGRDFVKNPKIDSLFSLGILDQRRNELIITRDWPGRIPLFYYYNKKDRQFLFSSELKGLRELEWLPLGDAVELTPGDIVSLDLDSFELTIKPYFRPQPRKTTLDLLGVGLELHKALTQSAKHRTMGDVPICTMFSGGIDSLLGTYYVLSGIDFERVGYRPTGYVFAVEDHVSEDVRRARFCAEGFKDIDFQLREIRVSGNRIINDIPDIVETFETRKIKALSVYPLPLYYYLAPEMHKDGFKVTIGGHGADELLGAYDAWKELQTPHKVQIKPKSRMMFMSAIYENMLRRASIIFMNHGPIEARFPFLDVNVCETMLGIDPKWLSLTPDNAELLLTLIDERAGPSGGWTGQLSDIHGYLTRYLDNNGLHPEDANENEVLEIEKLFWKLPLIVAGMHAARESWLPFWTLFNAKLRGQHGAGITALEPMLVKRYHNLGDSDGEIFQSMVNRAFRLEPEGNPESRPRGSP